MKPNSRPALRVSAATLADQRAALSLVFANLPADVREPHLAEVLREHVSRPVDGLWVGYRGDQLVAATLAQVQPGRTASFSTPQVVPGQPVDTAPAVAAAVLDELARQDVRLIQALPELDHGPAAELLKGLGFRHVSNLLYLVSLRSVFPTAEPQTELTFTSFRPTERARLTSLVEKTYAGSLDCPDIDGVRAMEDVLAGYEATGQFDPARWIIAQSAGADIGCVLLTDHPQLNQWELLYMGVVPAARGRNFGVAIARYAQWLAGQTAAQRLVLAVDAANEPAIRMYAAAGFVSYDRRSVFLRVL